MKIPLYVFAAAALMSGSLVASAQSYQTAVSLPGITGSVIIYTGAPEGFDPISASAEELEAYGYPRRPDPDDAPAYANWVRAVSTTRVTPQFAVTNRYHGPIHKIGLPAVKGNTSFVGSGNWSGYVLTGNGSPPFIEAAGVWYVPDIGTQFRSTQYTPPLVGYSSEWVGMDGYNSNDVIQDGTEADFYGGSAHYAAWWEVFPAPETKITNVSIHAGDLISAYSEKVVVNGKVSGKFYLANLSTRQSFSLSHPASATFFGTSAEWIFERPSVNGVYDNPLPSYARSYMSGAYALKSGSNNSIYYSTQPNVNIKMCEGNCTVLSDVVGEDSKSMWFEWKNYF